MTAASLRHAFILACALVRASAQDAAPPVMSSGSVVDSAGYTRNIAPGSLVTAFGSNFARETSEPGTVPLSVSLSGAWLEIDDGAQVYDAPLFLVSPGQINAQMPYLPAGAGIAVRVRNGSGISDADYITLLDAAPSLFTDGSGNPLLFHSDASPVTPGAPAEAGENVTAWLTGLGAVDPPLEAGAQAGGGDDAGITHLAVADVAVAVGGAAADVQFAGLAPGQVGIGQVQFNVPGMLASGSYELEVRAGTRKSQPGLMAAVRNPSPPRQFWVAPGGSPAGDGSKDNPWDLKTALAPAPDVRPGDTLWLRGGFYGDGSTIFQSRLAGTTQKPITVRQAPGERATINGGLAIYGPYTWYWGFEVTNTGTDRGPSRNVPECVDTYDGSTGVKLINLVLHDCNQGLGFWIPAENAEAYGNLIYYNGNQGADRGHGHGIYTQNQNGTKTIADNIIFDQFGLGIQAYGSSAAFVQGYDVRGNIVFNNGSISAGATNVDNILFGIGIPMARIRLEDNYTYHTPGANKGYSRIGWEFSQALNKDVAVRRNYWIGGQMAFEVWNWGQAVFTGNVAYSKDALCGVLALASGQSTAPYSWDVNTYYGAGKFRFDNGQNQDWSGWQSATGLDAKSRYITGRPSGLWAFVRPNKYEPGRANIVVYNWDLAGSVQVDVSAVLKPGANYEIRDAQNFFGEPVAAGAWDGSPVAIPMTGLRVAPPVGSVPTPPLHTAPEFGVFVLISK